MSTSDNGQAAGLVRLASLSDGVFAIAMTLLAFDLNLPTNRVYTAASLFRLLAPQLQAFLWSFAAIGIFWAMHHQMFSRLKRADGVAGALNLTMLALVTLVPVATRLQYQEFSATAVLIIIALFFIIGIVNGALWFYAAFVGDLLLVEPPLTLKVYNLLITTFVPAVMTALGVLSYFPSLHWTPALIPVVALLLVWGRRRFAKLYALPAPRADDPVTPSPA